MIFVEHFCCILSVHDVSYSDDDVCDDRVASILPFPHDSICAISFLFALLMKRVNSLRMTLLTDMPAFHADTLVVQSEV